MPLDDDRQAADEPAAVELPARRPSRSRSSPARRSWRWTRSRRAPSACSTSGSSARSRRSSTPGRSATRRCWSPPRSTPRTPTAPPQIINSHPGVSHNYLRTHEFNLWFTIATPPDSELGLEGTLEVLQARDRRRVDPPAADADAVQDQHEPGDGAGNRGAGGGGRRCATARARAPALRRHGHRRDPRPAGADGGRRPPLRRRRGQVGMRTERFLEHLRGDGRAQAPAAGGGDPLPPPRRVLGQRDGGLEGARGPRSWRSAGGWPPCAGSPTATSGPTYPDWPYSVFTMAHGRSKEECDAVLDSIAEEHGTARRRPRGALLLDRVQEGAAALLHRRLRQLGGGARRR